MNQLEQAIIKGFNIVGEEVSGAIRRTFGTHLDNAEETHYLVLIDADNQGNGFITLGAAGVGNGFFSIGADSDFVAVAIMSASPLLSDLASANQPFTFILRDGSTDRDFSNEQIHSALSTGTGQDPFYFPKPRIFSRNSDIRADLTNLMGVSIKVYMALLGYKIYDDTQLDLTAPR